MEEAKERKIMKLLLKVKNGTPPQRKSALRQLTDKAREFGAGPLFNQILPLLMSPTLEDQERHLLVKVRLRCVPNPVSPTSAPLGWPPFSAHARGTQLTAAWSGPGQPSLPVYWLQSSRAMPWCWWHDPHCCSAWTAGRSCKRCMQVIDRILYKLDELVRPFVHKILVVIEPLLIDEDYYARVEGREIIANLSKAAGLATMIAAMRPDIDNIDE